jgi:hypothetical protein
MFKRIIMAVLIAAGLVGTTWGAQAASAAPVTPAVHVVNITEVVHMAPGIANAKTTGYAANGVLADAAAVSSQVGFTIYTTVSNTRLQIWYNGAVHCVPFGGGTVTWCGVAGGNGTSQIDSGLNFSKYAPDGTLWKYYLRMELLANGTCTLHGSFNAYAGVQCRY